MITNHVSGFHAALLALVTAVTAVAAPPRVALDLSKAAEEPADAAGNPAAKVKVYILAGQSNMVGFGTLKGARPQYPGIFLTPDPAVIPGEVRVGRDARGLGRCRITRSVDADAPRGALASVYAGAYDPNRDYASLQPIATAVVPLGTTAATLPTHSGPATVVVSAALTVPATGTYTVHPGFGDSTRAVALLNGTEVYRRDGDDPPALTRIPLQAGKRYPLKVIYLRGGSAAFWLEQVDLEGQGDLESLIKRDGKFRWLMDADGAWTVRGDVTYAEARIAQAGRWEPLSATSNGKHIGPEVPFGWVMGTFHQEPVLLIEASMGNRGLWWDFRPPSSGTSGSEGADKWEGLEYRLMVKGVRSILDRIDQVVPGYNGQGYEIAGFVWWQGHKDAYSGQPEAEYEQNLVNLIGDLRKEFGVPKMPAAIATVGFDGYGMPEKVKAIWRAQMAVSDPNKHPELAGTVATVDTRPFWRDSAHSPSGAGYHYNHNAETYVLTGDALGRAMVRLLGGDAEERPLPPPPAETDEARPEPTEEALAASKAATAPMVLDGLLAAFRSEPRNRDALEQAAAGVPPKRPNQFLRDSIDTLAGYYSAVGVTEYDWHRFGPELQHADWRYLTFDPPEQKDKAKGGRYRKVTFPAGADTWYSPDFDDTGWQTGTAPFGQVAGKLAPLGRCGEGFCGCGIPPKTLWDKEVLLMRKTVTIPPLRDGHRYRLVVGGSAHVNAGEGFELYVDGTLLAKSKSGVGKRQGGQPRGGHIFAGNLPDLRDGKATIALISFLRYHDPRKGAVPPRGHISVWLEEQKIPPLTQ